MIRRIDWIGSVGTYKNYKFSLKYNEKSDRWLSHVERAPFRAIVEIGRYYTSQDNAKDSCEDYLSRQERESK